MNCKVYQTESESIKKFKGESRFIVVRESISSHCCFGYTVVDTSWGKRGGSWERIICEKFEEVDALEVCNALNFHAENETK